MTIHRIYYVRTSDQRETFLLAIVEKKKRIERFKLYAPRIEQLSSFLYREFEK